jgi:hypothetical protein
MPRSALEASELTCKAGFAEQVVFGAIKLNSEHLGSIKNLAVWGKLLTDTEVCKPSL